MLMVRTPQLLSLADLELILSEFHAVSPWSSRDDGAVIAQHNICIETIGDLCKTLASKPLGCPTPARMVHKVDIGSVAVLTGPICKKDIDDFRGNSPLLATDSGVLAVHVRLRGVGLTPGR
jgi:hypothetical protein